MLILDMTPALHVKQVGTGALECSENTCLKHSTGKQVSWSLPHIKGFFFFWLMFNSFYGNMVDELLMSCI